VLLQVWCRTERPLVYERTQVGCTRQIFQRFGSPVGEDLDYYSKMTLLSTQFLKFPAPGLESLCGGQVPAVPAAVMQGMTALNPNKRITASKVCSLLQGVAAPASNVPLAAFPVESQGQGALLDDLAADLATPTSLEDGLNMSLLTVAGKSR